MPVLFFWVKTPDKYFSACATLKYNGFLSFSEIKTTNENRRYMMTHCSIFYKGGGTFADVNANLYNLGLATNQFATYHR
jgi:hypothetical protein